MNFLRKGALITAMILFITRTAYAADGLDGQEQSIIDWITGHSEAALAELEVALAIDSPTENFGGQGAMAKYYSARFRDLGFETEWIDLLETTGRAGHFQAELDGGKGKRVLLLGHLDTVLPAVEIRRDGNLLYGSGSVDMKGGNMVVLFALQALQAAGVLEDRRLIVHFTGDEESTGRPIDVTRAPLRAAAERSDVALSFEGGRPGRAVVARRSVGRWTLIVESVTGHSSRVFSEELGYGAIFEAARMQSWKGPMPQPGARTTLFRRSLAPMVTCVPSAWSNWNGRRRTCSRLFPPLTCREPALPSSFQTVIRR